MYRVKKYTVNIKNNSNNNNLILIEKVWTLRKNRLVEIWKNVNHSHWDSLLKKKWDKDQKHNNSVSTRLKINESHTNEKVECKLEVLWNPFSVSIVFSFPIIPC